MVLTTMCHQKVVGITTRPPQSLQFFGTSGGIVSDRSGEVQHGAFQETNSVFVVTASELRRFRKSWLAALKW